MSNQFSEIFDIRVPIISAPMGGVAGGELARAVSDAGGLGLVGVSYGNPDFIAGQLPIAARATGPWGVGIVMFTFDNEPGLLESVLSYRPDVLALSFGDPDRIRRFVDAGKAAGAKISVQVHDVAGARSAVAAGADLVIAQGSEAGGHHKVDGPATMALIPAVVDAVGAQVPVAAAGGIADGRGMAAALALGAGAVMVGTRFAAAAEALTSPSFLDRLLAARSDDLVHSRAFDIVRQIPWSREYTARSIDNSFTHRWANREEELAERSGELLPEWMNAVAADNSDERALFAGQIVDLVQGVEPAAAIVANLIDEARAATTAAGHTLPSASEFA